MSMLVPEVEPWRLQARCRGHPNPEIFFPPPGVLAEDAKNVCRLCVVRWECARHAVEHGEFRGIWGGMTSRERRRWAKANGVRRL